MPRAPADPLKLFGAHVRGRRRAMGLNQEELAHKAKLDRTYIGGVERGERNLSLKNIHAIAKALDITAGRLIDEDVAEE